MARYRSTKGKAQAAALLSTVKPEPFARLEAHAKAEGGKLEVSMASHGRKNKNLTACTIKCLGFKARAEAKGPVAAKAG